MISEAELTDLHARLGVIVTNLNDISATAAYRHGEVEDRANALAAMVAAVVDDIATLYAGHREEAGRAHDRYEALSEQVAEQSALLRGLIETIIAIGDEEDGE